MVKKAELQEALENLMFAVDREATVEGKHKVSHSIRVTTAMMEARLLIGTTEPTPLAEPEDRRRLA